jgi:hypothetical protein
VLSFERIILSASKGDGLDLRQFLGFERNYTHLGSLEPSLHATSGVMTSLSSQNKSNLSMLLVSYRMVDIKASLEFYPQLPTEYEKSSTSLTNIQVIIFFLPQFNHVSIFISISIVSITGRLFSLISGML